ncbi:hypothetical protein OH77DRAFT_1102362 [Trametes cingulata]|nr:hypothetical protein OH77DRAFT_1102362 [Trametes cingulata]
MNKPSSPFASPPDTIRARDRLHRPSPPPSPRPRPRPCATRGTSPRRTVRPPADCTRVFRRCSQATHALVLRRELEWNDPPSEFRASQRVSEAVGLPPVTSVFARTFSLHT